MGKVDEAALLTRASGGDEAAFGELFARYQRQIYRYAERVCGCASGDDVVQATGLEFLSAIPRVTVYFAVAAWVATFVAMMRRVWPGASS